MHIIYRIVQKKYGFFTSEMNKYQYTDFYIYTDSLLFWKWSLQKTSPSRY